MNAQRRRENALLKREGWMEDAFMDVWISAYGVKMSRKHALRLIVSQAASALAVSPKKI